MGQAHDLRNDLESRYSDVKGKLIDEVICSICLYTLQNDDAIVVDPKTDIEDFAYVISTLSDKDILSIWNVGKKKLEFLRRVQNDYPVKSVYDKIARHQKAERLNDRDMAYKLHIGEVLLRMIKKGEVTHPNIVKRIQKYFKLTDLEVEVLLPENRRPHSEKYDPDKYVTNPLRAPIVNRKTADDKAYEEYLATLSSEYRNHHVISVSNIPKHLRYRRTARG